jgi:hypothetical protein
MNSEESYQKIYQLLNAKGADNLSLGVELIKASADVNLIIKFLSTPWHMSYKLCYLLTPYFQEFPEIWEKVSPALPPYKRDIVMKFLPHRILTIEGERTTEAFVKLCNQNVKEFFPNFPSLDLSIIKIEHNNHYVSTQHAKEVQNNIGWELYIESRDVGPAEVIHEEEWEIKAIHPDFNLIFRHFESNYAFPETWMEIDRHL